MKRDPRKYVWYEYTSNKKATLHTNTDVKVTFTSGDKFGLKKYAGNYFLVPGNNLVTQFKLTPTDVDRLLNNSKGYEGKISRYKVSAGTEGRAGTQHKENSMGYKELKANSTVLRRVFYSETEQRLIVTFPNGDDWVYWPVTPTEARALERSPSQGRYFNLAIKAKKHADRLEDIM